MPVNAGQILPASPVKPGMSEIEAGQQFSDYMERAARESGNADGDIDLFDEDRTTEAPADASSSGEGTDQRDQRRPDENRDSSGDADGEQADPGDAGEEASAEASEEAQQQDDSTQEEADAEVQIEASQLAEMLGVDENALVVGDDGAIQLRYRVDGEAGQATLKDVLTSYQLQGHVRRKDEALSEERKQLQETALKNAQGLQQAYAQVQEFSAQMEQRVVDRFEKVDWDRLKAEDPGRAAMLQMEMSSEMQSIRDQAEKARTEVQNRYQEHIQQQQAAHQQWLMQQQAALYEHIPELRDDTTRVETLTKYERYLAGLGFRPEEIRNLHDHRYLRVVHDAVMGRRAEPAADEQKAALVKKRLVKVPKVGRGGSPRPEQEARTDARQRSAKRLRQSGSDEDAARFAVESGIIDDML